ncbi:MAG: mechanosensitive ion channel [Fusobacterium gastrosuis]|uniref:mechanosensitive ion channel family protein n=1 Tax=Fusobacterium gastrosuis TaxID=1755100 RepID=UPI002A87C299|nr:mechanosensitive ion channel [Fusobacterium gastrosuis]
MEKWMNSVIELITAAGGKIILAIVVLFIGKIIINCILRSLKNSKVIEKLDTTAGNFAISALKGLLYVILVIAVIGILGVPMASVITVLASCGIAVGLALQGALSNLAGGIMLMVFRPFQVGNYVDASGVSGVVQEINLFYTVILTSDNKRITIPNGSLMNANIVDYSAEELRRVDLVFSCAKTESPAEIQKLLLETAVNTNKVLKEPGAFARLSGGTNEAMEFTVKAWCNNADYWDVYFDITQNVVEAFGKAGVKQPAARISVETQSK